MVESEIAYELERVMKEDVREYLVDNDINHLMSAGIILKTSLGSHIMLREVLERLGAVDLIYYTITGDKLFIAKWHELSKEKQGEWYARTRK